jgi:hypothetical protein
MRTADMNELLRRQPFRPFRIHLSNGTSYDIQHPELAVVGRTTMFIGIPAPDMPTATYDHFAIVTLLHINNVEPLPATPSSTSDGQG